jgi:Fic family protein
MKNKFYPELPHNNLPILPPTFNFDDVEILKKVNTANIALTRLSGEAKSIPNRHLLIEPLSFREAVASSEIENIHTTFNEAIQVTYLEESELKIEQKETKNYREALLKGYNLVTAKEFLNTNSLQKYRLEIKDKTKIYSADLIEYLFSSPFYNQKTLQTSLGISRNTTSKYFSELERLYLIQSYKYKNDKIYYSPEFQSLLK